MDTFGRVTIYNSTRCTTLVVPPISQYCLPLVSKLKCKCLHYLYVMYICIHTHTHTLTSIFPHYVCSSCAVGLKIDKLVGDNNSWLLASPPAKLELGNESKLQIIEIYVGIQLWSSIESCLTLFYTHFSLSLFWWQCQNIYSNLSLSKGRGYFCVYCHFCSLFVN